MTDNFLGELRVFPYDRIPRGWAACNGQTLNIPQYQALYTLLGTTFGGDGTSTFGLPDLRGRVALCTGRADDGTVYTRGQTGGTESVALTASQMPPHTHAIEASTATGKPAPSPAGNYLGPASQSATGVPAFPIYGPPVASGWAALNGGTFGSSGGGQPHENRQPVLPLQICIALIGIYPPHE